MRVDTCVGTGATAGESRGLGCSVGVGFKTVGSEHRKRRPESDKVCCDGFSRLCAGALGSGPCICQFYNPHLR